MRLGRDERPDIFDYDINAGVDDFWQRFQKPFATLPETTHLDDQVIKGVVEELMSFTGWAAAACGSLARPFGAHKSEDTYHDLISHHQLYYFALVVHSADHFLMDQLAAVVQMSRKLGTHSVYVSIVDYGSTDATPFLCDLTEAVLTLLGISFRIRRVDPMTSDPAAAYYPLEEAYTRNLALEPLQDLWRRRKVKFAKVIWLKGFACPMDIMEMLRVSTFNDAALTCSMDWKEHNGFFIYNDRWRTRDIFGNLFRGSKSTSSVEEAPPRDPEAIARYEAHLPFQVFCCESGVHIVDPHRSYYLGLTYRSSYEWGVFNLTASGDKKAPKWSEGPCMDSAQTHFCRDLFLVAARDGVIAQAKTAKALERSGKPRGLDPEYELIVKAVTGQKAVVAEVEQDEGDENDEEEDGPDKDTIAAADAAGAALAPGEQLDEPEEVIEELPVREPKLRKRGIKALDNSAFEPARIIVNPRCVTTYAGVSHTQLALDLFGTGDDAEPEGHKYQIDKWSAAPETFVCQEMRTTGGRTAAKQQRRTAFRVAPALAAGWQPS